MLTNTRRRKELHEQELDEYYAQLKFIVIGEMQDALRRLFGKKLKRRWLIFDTAMGSHTLGCPQRNIADAGT